MDRIHNFGSLDGTHRGWSVRGIRHGYYFHAGLELFAGFVFELVSPFVFNCHCSHSLTKKCSAASAFAANTMLRSLVGASFPLFSKQMFENLGVQWAATLLGCIAALMIPIPIAFRMYGPKIRQRSRLSPTSNVGTGRP